MEEEMSLGMRVVGGPCANTGDGYGSLSLQDSEKYVEELLTLFNRFSRLVKEAFHDDSRFLTSRDKVRQSS